MASTQQLRASTFAGRSLRPALKAAPSVARRQRTVTHAGYLGSPTNLVFLISTTAFLAAGRFGLAPTAKLHTKAGTKLYKDDSEGLTTSDPGGYTAVDVLVGGSQGHVIAVGIVLGMRALGIMS